jgi:hypothetical protein
MSVIGLAPCVSFVNDAGFNPGCLVIKHRLRQAFCWRRVDPSLQLMESPLNDRTADDSVMLPKDDTRGTQTDGSDC